MLCKLRLIFCIYYCATLDVSEVLQSLDASLEEREGPQNSEAQQSAADI